jgi:hypothetical protein
MEHLGYQYEPVLIENIGERGSQELRGEFRMRSVETRNARTSFRDLGFDGGGTFRWWRLSNAVRLDQESIAKWVCAARPAGPWPFP